jgi:HK97 family phage portal protein
MSLVHRAVASREHRTWTPSWLDTLLGIQRRDGYWAGVPVDERRALQHGTVYRCVSLISDTIAQLPVGAHIGAGPMRMPVDDPPILISPLGPGVTWVEWIGMMATSALLRGNGFGEVLARDSREFPTLIQPLHPDEVKVRLDASGPALYYIPGRKTPTMRYPLGDVWHVKGMTLPGRAMSVLGLSPIEYQAQTIGAGLAAEEFGARFFGDGAQPSGILTTAADIEHDEAKDMQQRWIDAHGDRQRKVAVLGNGLSWQQISITPNESQFLETIRAKREEIAGWYGVPLHKLGMADKQSNWGTGVEESNLQWLQDGIGIWLARFEAALTALLPKPQYVKFNLNGLQRARYLDRMQGYSIERQIGMSNVDDILAKEDRPPLPDGLGESYSQPLNWGPVPGSPDTPVTPSPPSAP